MTGSWGGGSREEAVARNGASHFNLPHRLRLPVFPSLFPFRWIACWPE